MKTLDYFVSYTSADQDWAEWVSWQLTKSNRTVRLQAWDFRPGESFIKHMQEGLTAAEFVLAILSPEYFASKYAGEEWKTALAGDLANGTTRLIPVRVKPCSPPGMMSHRIYIDLHGAVDEAEAIELLHRSLAGGGRPTEAPKFPKAIQTVQRPFPGDNQNQHPASVPQGLLRTFSNKLEMPGDYWRQLSMTAQETFLLLGRSNKSWIQRSDAQRARFAADLARLAQAGGTATLFSDGTSEARDVMLDFLTKSLRPLLESDGAVTEHALAMRIRYFSLECAIHYQAVRSDDTIVVLPLLNSESFREESIVLQLEREQHPHQFESYADDLVRLQDQASQILWIE